MLANNYSVMQPSPSPDFRPKRFLLWVCVLLLSFWACEKASAQDRSNNNRLMLGVSYLYERGLDATVAVEHEMRYHNAWEFFGTIYTQYDTDPDAGHITRQSFWTRYNTWHVGIAYKPCVSRGRNHHGNFRLGASGGSDLHKFKGGIHVGYEHSYALKGKWELFFQVKEDVIIKGDDMFRTGLALGLKVPL